MIVVIILILLLLLGLTAASQYFYTMAIARRPKTFLAGNPDLKDTPASDPVWLDAQPLQAWELLSGDGLRLRGYYLPALRDTSRIVLLAHGYSGSGKMHMNALAKLYHEQLGYHVLLPDARGHGDSEGAYIGFGWPDRRDVLLWIGELIRRFGGEAQIVLHGVSMGGATVLMTSGEPLPPQVKAVVSDCAYTSVKDVLSYQLRRMYKLPSFPFIGMTSLVTRLRSGYSFGEASALEAVRRAEKPILFIHGSADTFVPTSMVHRLMEACRGYKELFLVPGAGHGMAYTAAPEEYAWRVRQFTERFVRETAPQPVAQP
ncbi:alpha/beta hydrolase [Paenibacillus mucilaginosus]|uniref:Peptidase S15 n=1 Tax=Paenibacillus mucilaginosus (strain KNP414) TaxID=1036673 RepID=F8F9R8_PAEMK|nr:alpha/beta hydrolase [Paenibacillus mucilaginosus]AEI44397.1 peptidase S15 [Paenibacillus mucilaginosus KNP414]MCG7213777.1 alpha/beta hydrolase [Paenibacillus mucilaginosus]WDM25789.1 alpha/beta hydrolase [Paenibacillus mucilaginosus]